MLETRKPNGQVITGSVRLFTPRGCTRGLRLS
jgi:hypothetical protein